MITSIWISAALLYAAFYAWYVGFSRKLTPAEQKELDALLDGGEARFELGPEGATVEDLGAKNRVKVNGVRIERRPLLLRPGDLITVGETDLAVQTGDGVDQLGQHLRSQFPQMGWDRSYNFQMAILDVDLDEIH